MDSGFSVTGAKSLSCTYSANAIAWAEAYQADWRELLRLWKFLLVQFQHLLHITFMHWMSAIPVGPVWSH